MVRYILKGQEPSTLGEVRNDRAISFSDKKTARNKFNQLDKKTVRSALVVEQNGLCAFCMRRINAESVDENRQYTMKIAHRTPIDRDYTLALTWTNLLGACPGILTRRSESGLETADTCDTRQGNSGLAVDPTQKLCIGKIGFKRIEGSSGLHITSDDDDIRMDLLDTLGLNEGDLPNLREALWRGFLESLKRANRTNHWEPDVRRKYFSVWKWERPAILREYVGTVELMWRKYFFDSE